MNCERCNKIVKNISSISYMKKYHCECGMNIDIYTMSGIGNKYLDLSDFRIIWNGYIYCFIEKKIKYKYVEIARVLSELIPYDITEDRLKMILVLL